MKDLPDAELMRLAAVGREDAFAEIVRRYQDVLLNFFLRSSVSYCDGQELAQRTFLRLWKYRKKYRGGEAKFTTFLFMVARQISIDFFRAERVRHEQAERLLLAASDPGFKPRRAVASARGGEVLRAMSRLTPALREAVELVVFQDLPYAQAGKILKLPLGTVKSRIFNAMTKLKEYMAYER